jgi:hypothetical protein
MPTIASEATQAEVDELLAKMAEGRATLLTVIEDTDEAQTAIRPPEGEGPAGWSVKEQLVHLADMDASYCT